MNNSIYPANGEKLTFSSLDNVSLPKHQVDTIKKYLKPNNDYTVKGIEVLNYETRIYFKEFPSVYFNLKAFDGYKQG